MVAAAGAAPSLTGGFQNFGFDAPVAKPLEEFEQRNVIITFFPHMSLKQETVTVSVLGKVVVSSRMLRTFAPSARSLDRTHPSSSLGRARPVQVVPTPSRREGL